MDALTSLLREDVSGRSAVRALAPDPRRRRALVPRARDGCRGSRLIATEANGMPAFGQYKPDPAGGLAPWSLQVVELDGERIKAITFFLDTQRFFPMFGLPPHLD